MALATLAGRLDPRRLCRFDGKPHLLAELAEAAALFFGQFLTEYRHLFIWRDWSYLHFKFFVEFRFLVCVSESCCLLAKLIRFVPCPLWLWGLSCNTLNAVWTQHSTKDVLTELRLDFKFCRSFPSCHCSWWCLTIVGFKLLLWTSSLLFCSLHIVLTCEFFPVCIPLRFLSCPILPFVLFHSTPLQLVVRYQHPSEYTSDTSPCLSWGTMATTLMAPTKMITPYCTLTYIWMLRSHHVYLLVCSQYSWCLLPVPRLHLQFHIQQMHQAPLQLNYFMQSKWPFLMRLQVDFHSLQFCILFIRILHRQHLIPSSWRLMIDLRFDQVDNCLIQPIGCQAVPKQNARHVWWWTIFFWHLPLWNSYNGTKRRSPQSPRRIKEQLPKNTWRGQAWILRSYMQKCRRTSTTWMYRSSLCTTSAWSPKSSGSGPFPTRPLLHARPGTFYAVLRILIEPTGLLTKIQVFASVFKRIHIIITLMVDPTLIWYRHLSLTADWQFWHSDLPWLSSWLSAFPVDCGKHLAQLHSSKKRGNMLCAFFAHTFILP